MSPRHGRVTQIMAALFLMGFSGGALSQSQTTTARQDGKAFATEIGKRAQDAAKRTPNADALPNFGATPSQSTLFDDPDALARAASEAAATLRHHRGSHGSGRESAVAARRGAGRARHGQLAHWW